jgi:hypothetical protein
MRSECVVTANPGIIRFGVFTVVAVKNAIFCYDMPAAHVSTDVSEERVASIIRLKRISEPGT